MNKTCFSVVFNASALLNGSTAKTRNNLGKSTLAESVQRLLRLTTNYANKIEIQIMLKASS